MNYLRLFYSQHEIDFFDLVLLTRIFSAVAAIFFLRGTREINNAVRLEYFMIFNFQEYRENTSCTKSL